MDVSVVLEFRFYKTPDGKVWSPNIFGYSFWQRYLEVFDAVRVGAAVSDVDSVLVSWRRADGNRVQFVPFPHDTGLFRYLADSENMKKTARLLTDNGNAVILRIPAIIAHLLVPLLRATEQPYGVEVTTDPYGFYSPGSTEHPLRPFMQRYFTYHQRRQCSAAYAASYATKNFLQELYPTGGLTTHYSNVELSRSDILSKPCTEADYRKTNFRIVFVGTLHNYVKSPDVLLHAVSLCVKRGMDIRLCMIGDGRIRPEVEKIAESLALSGRVAFMGNVSSKEIVINELDASDLFILPSRTETIPRAMVEAMARALPCIGTQAGGMPELLAPEDLVPHGSGTALADKIFEVLNDPVRLAQMSARNRETAGNYCNEALDNKRVEFYSWIKDATEEWLMRR